VTRIRDLATFSNPEYFRKKATRASTWNAPRVIRCSDDTPASIALPRGCEEALLHLAQEKGLAIERTEQLVDGAPIDATFHGTLTPLQSDALTAVLAHDVGVLVLPTGVGKTVVATAAIAARNRSTLVLVNRRPLLEQWRARRVPGMRRERHRMGRSWAP
jgi:hypothetical protein